jgi:uncharacterized membrane protein
LIRTLATITFEEESGMQPQQLVFGLVKFVHDFFTAVWIGGLFAIGAIVVPSLLSEHGRTAETRRTMQAIQARLSLWVYGSIVALTVTGILMGRRNPAFGGMFSFANTYSTTMALKHILVLAMVVIAVLRSRGLDAIRSLKNAHRVKLKWTLLYANLALGILVVLLSGLAAAFGAGQPPVR